MTHEFKVAVRHSTRALCLLVAVYAFASGQEQPAASGSGSASAAYEAKLAEWRSLLTDMRMRQMDYVEADPSKMGELEVQWKEVVAQGEQLLEEVRKAGMAAYAEAPGQDRQLERFLVKLLDDSIDRDSYEVTAELSQVLLENGCEISEVYDIAGVAAFVLNDYETAEQHLTRAEQLGALNKGSEYKALIPQYKEFWAAEQALRAAEAEAGDLPRVKMMTSKGEIVLELFENEAPETVGNFVNLVEKGFYDGLTFHRVMQGFMAQGGCPLGTGGGGPGYNIYCECFQPNHRKHFRGSLSMAKQQPPDTGGSQFFLTFVPTAHLNGKHTVFGRVIEGMEVLERLQRIDPEAASKPQPDVIEKVEVLNTRDHEYVPNKVS